MPFNPQLPFISQFNTTQNDWVISLAFPGKRIWRGRNAVLKSSQYCAAVNQSTRDQSTLNPLHILRCFIPLRCSFLNVLETSYKMALVVGVYKSTKLNGL